MEDKVECEFDTGRELGELREITAQLENGHVIEETLQTKTDYTGERI